MAGSQNPGYTLPGAKKPEKEPYCLDFALRDTAGEVRKLRNRKIAVLGANVVGRYLRKQITELL